MKHELPDLPYPLDALEPHMSRETLEYHHGKHHATYVEKLNGLIEGTEFADADLVDIVRRADGAVFNNGAQAWNHAFFWNCLAAEGGASPTGELAQAIERDFGGTDALREKLSDAFSNLFGSGWIWLVRQSDGSLAVSATQNAGNPLTEGQVPLLTCDAWEHAYYIDYRNAKAKYFDGFWQRVNWHFVAQNYGREAPFDV